MCIAAVAEQGTDGMRSPFVPGGQGTGGRPHAGSGSGRDHLHSMQKRSRRWRYAAMAVATIAAAMPYPRVPLGADRRRSRRAGRWAKGWQYAGYKTSVLGDRGKVIEDREYCAPALLPTCLMRCALPAVTWVSRQPASRPCEWGPASSSPGRTRAQIIRSPTPDLALNQ